MQSLYFLSNFLNFLFTCRYIHVHVLHCEECLTSLLQESQGLITYAFVMLLLAMISLHMLTFTEAETAVQMWGGGSVFMKLGLFSIIYIHSEYIRHKAISI